WVRSQDDSDEIVQMRAFDAAGAPRAAVFNTRGFSAVSFLNGYDIAAIPGGSGVIFTYSQVDDLGSGVHLVQFDIGGTAGPDFTGAGSATPGNFFGPSVAVYPDGSVVLGEVRTPREVT